MARAIWTGALGFGLVNVPVGLYSATEDKSVHFNQFERGTSSRIRYRRVNEDTGQEVDYDDIVKGEDIGDGRYVIVAPEELEEIAPGRSRVIDISDFVDVAEIDPIFYQKTYYLAPQDDQAQRAYALLLQAMERAGRVGIATFVMRSKQYLAAIRPQGEVLTLETMFFADEVRDPVDEIEQLPVRQSFKSRDLDMAVSLIDSMTTEWDPGNYRDTYRDRVNELIEAKRRGDEVVTEGEPETASNVVDLMEALSASVANAKGHRPGNAQDTGGLTTRRAGADANGGDSDRPAEDLGDLSKKELYDQAQELDVAGRSKMTKDELEDAVRAARQGDGRASKAS
ncbi:MULTISPECIES: non-homologous end joining protein Ku [unclassified Modestobacter]|uniref:non-homologous end joining protein Ku n=1 Tax=unclassified Modestobacter TaxID=2643866 RepID=UPI0022AAC692|nr:MULTISPECIES: Ku protein [unclassified Modestobacter]MCZ2824312.1 Ku protein [Modestobacter sp. VKM Ac-2981]MCZ2854160.1 Ku protein [Modestobacter sp. VKM Ac-2982]